MQYSQRDRVNSLNQEAGQNQQLFCPSMSLPDDGEAPRDAETERNIIKSITRGLDAPVAIASGKTHLKFSVQLDPDISLFFQERESGEV